MPGIRHTTAADGSFTTDGASAWNGEEAHTLSDVASQSDLNALSNAVSVDHVALSARITSVAGLAGGGSVTSAEVQAVSVAAQSAVNTVSNALSVETANRVSAVNVVSNAVSALSQANSAAHVSINGRIDTLSQGLSVLSNTNSAEHAGLSNRITSVAGLAGGGSVTSNELSAVDAALSARITSVANAGGGGGSVTSNELSAVDAALSARINSVGVAAGAPVIRMLQNNQSTVNSAIEDISGFVLTVAAGETWEIEGMMLFSTSATTTGLRMGWSVPPLSTPRFGRFIRHSGGQSAGMAGAAGVLQVSGRSTNMSIGGGGPAAGGYIVTTRHMVNVASAGTMQLMYAGIASTAASPVHILAGSYLKAIKIS